MTGRWSSHDIKTHSINNNQISNEDFAKFRIRIVGVIIWQMVNQAIGVNSHVIGLIPHHVSRYAGLVTD